MPAFSFTKEEAIPIGSDEEHELVAVKLALYARALSLFQGCLLLIENDRQLDFRIHARGVIEAAMYLIALDRDPGFVSMMKDDDWKSRQSRAELHLSAKKFEGRADIRKMLEDFVAQGSQGAKPIRLTELVNAAAARTVPAHRARRQSTAP